jgi:hypothetical protein
MPRGPNRTKVTVECAVGKNRSVYVKVYTKERTLDISYPDRQTAGFYLRHIKGLREEDAIGIRECLNRLTTDGVLRS